MTEQEKYLYFRIGNSNYYAESIDDLVALTTCKEEDIITRTVPEGIVLSVKNK